MSPNNSSDPLRTTTQPPPGISAGGGTTDFTPAETFPDTVTHTPQVAPVVMPAGLFEEVPTPLSIPGYEIVGILGRGSMGMVYQARHLALKRMVALKMVLQGGLARQRELNRFRIEAETIARLQHPNIVQIYDVGEARGCPYCALEFVEGGTLAEKLDGQPLTPRDAAAMVEPLARAMQAAHARNVVHRDLKPANILLTADGTPKITDFGLARQLDVNSGETQPGAVMGTPSYMAPEQASGRTREAGPLADVYSLGAILYECLTGKPPFRGSTVAETLVLVLTTDPVPPSRLSPTVPDNLEKICLKAMAKEPAERYLSAGNLADALRRFLEDEPHAPRNWRPLRFNPALVGIVLTLCMVMIAGLYAIWRWSGQTAQPAVGGNNAKIEANSLGMQFARISPGQFEMGAPASETEALPHERPMHTVHITRPFEIGIHEVTFGQFRAFVETSGYQPKTELTGSSGYDEQKKEIVDKPESRFNWRNPGWKQTDDHPVVNVTWHDAKAFCDWLSRKEGKKYRLPTEAEWEYAARAGTRTRFWTGDDGNTLRAAENLADASLLAQWPHAIWCQPWNDSYAFTAPVGRFRPNPWGLYDMLGNVDEWTADWFDPEYYRSSPQSDPTGPTTGEIRVRKGGCLFNTPHDARSSHKWGDMTPDTAAPCTGFRVVREP